MGTFYENYLRLCNEIKKSPSAVALELGLTKTAVSNWKNRGTSPTDANAQLIADYFKISVADLVGEKEKSPASEDAELSLAKIQLIEKIKGMDDSLVDALNNLADQILSAQGK